MFQITKPPRVVHNLQRAPRVRSRCTCAARGLPSTSTAVVDVADLHCLQDVKMRNESCCAHVRPPLAKRASLCSAILLCHDPSRYFVQYEMLLSLLLMLLAVVARFPTSEDVDVVVQYRRRVQRALARGRALRALHLGPSPNSRHVRPPWKRLRVSMCRSPDCPEDVATER